MRSSTTDVPPLFSEHRGVQDIDVPVTTGCSIGHDQHARQRFRLEPIHAAHATRRSPFAVATGICGGSRNGARAAIPSRRFAAVAAQDRWVLDTAYGAWLDVVLPRVDLVVGLDYPRWFFLQRVFSLDPPVNRGQEESRPRTVAGKTVTRSLTPDQARRYQAWFDNARRLRDLLGELEARSLRAFEDAEG